MYYSDVSCNVENTLTKIEGLRIREFLPIDWMGIVTISNRNKILIDGERDFKNLGSSSVINLLKKIDNDMINMHEGKKFEISKNENLLISPIRVQDNYKVFYVCCNIEKSYSEKHIAILEFITKVVYENVLLNYEKMEERNYLYNIFNSIESSIISTNLEGIITMANKSTLDVLGWIPENIIGKSCYDFMLEENRKKISRVIEYVIENNKTYYIKELIQGNKCLNVSISYLEDIKNNVIGIVFITTDVTKMKIYEWELEQLKQFAILGELATGVAHDVRNPLMGIRGCASILKKSLSGQPKYIEFLEPIIDDVDRINEVVEQMLSYATMTKESCNIMLNIDEVLNKCLKVVRLHKESKHINIEKNTPHELPLIKGNNVQLQQAFINLLINAIQAIEDEGNIIIETYYLKDKDQILVKISDDGVGISPKKMKKIFTSFYSTKQKGIGYGLSIAKRSIDKHKGNIKVYSKLNEGTTFEIYLPAGKEKVYE